MRLRMRVSGYSKQAWVCVLDKGCKKLGRKAVYHLGLEKRKTRSVNMSRCSRQC